MYDSLITCAAGLRAYMRGKICLRDTTPIAVGHKREIFQHPHDDSLLIKIIPEHKLKKAWKPLTALLRMRNWRPGAYHVFHREIGEYICLHSINAQPSPAVQPIIGLVETDRGLGMVVEKLTDERGNMALPLKRLIQETGFSEQFRYEVERLRDELLRTGIVLNKLNTRNILYAYDEMHGKRFVIIDGLGRARRLPLQSWSRAFNRYYTRKQFRRLYREIARLLRETPAPAPRQIVLAQQ
jgi:hypothetical protein